MVFNAVRRDAQGQPEQCDDLDAKGTTKSSVHVSSTEQQQKLSGIGNKMTDSTSSAFPSVEDLNNAGASLLIFLLRLLTVISTKC